MIGNRLRRCGMKRFGEEKRAMRERPEADPCQNAVPRALSHRYAVGGFAYGKTVMAGRQSTTTVCAAVLIEMTTPALTEFAALVAIV